MNRKLRFSDYLAYGSGNTGLAIVNIIVQTWLLYFFAPPEGRILLPASLVGSIWFFGRIVDALSDPLISSWSDRLRSPRGRRLPFLLFTALPLSLALMALFTEPLFPAGAPMAAALVLALVLGLFYFLFTAYAVPYLALIPDLSPMRQDRLNLSTSSALFNLAGTGIAMILCGMLITLFSREQAFTSAAFVPAMGLMALLAFVTFLIPPLALKHLDRKNEAAAALPLVSAVRSVFKNRAFLFYVVGMNIFWGGFIIINVSVPYYVTVLMGESVGFTSVALGVTLGTALIFFPVINRSALKWGNKRIVRLCCLTMAIVLGLLYFIPAGLGLFTPKTAGLILMALAGAPIAGLFIIPNAMIAELSDFTLPDGSKPGEAIYFGFQGIVNKLMIGIVTLMTGFLFDSLGKSAAAPLGVQLTGPIGGVLALAAFLIFRGYEEKPRAD